MHPHLPTILALSATLASTIALPTLNNSTLESRGTNAWVGSFTDPTCSGPADPKGHVPSLGTYLDSCTQFQFVVGDYVGVNFGGGAWPWEGVTFFSDENCQVVSAFNAWKTVVPGPSGMACVRPVTDTDVVNSVAGTDYISE